jgi:hypothetical protein
MQTGIVTTLVLGACASAALTACSGQSDRPLPANGAGAFPEGTYTYADALEPLSTDRLAGREVDFDSGRYVLRGDDIVRIEGSYRVSGDTLVLESAVGPRPCPTGEYMWRTEGERLFLDVIEDPCDLRRMDLEAEPLLPGRAVIPPATAVPDVLDSAWSAYWQADDQARALANSLTADAVVEWPEATISGRDQIVATLGNAPWSRVPPRATPFAFERSDDRIIEKGRVVIYEVRPGQDPIPDPIRVEVTWALQPDGVWKIERIRGT